MAEMHAIRKLAHIRARAGRAPALREALARLEHATRQERGCLEFTFYQAITAEEDFVLVEHFADAAAFQQHMMLPHTRAFFEAGLVEDVRAEDLAP
jgi:quinol monooxygenase YgiN